MQAIKKCIKFLPMLILVMIMSLPVRAFAADRIDTEKKTSLTIHFTKETPYADAEFRLYRVADVSSDCKYTLTDKFKGSGVDLSKPDADTWRKLVTTFEGYVAAEKMEADYTDKTDATGAAVFTELPVGLYLVMGDSVKDGENKVTPVSFLVNLPNRDVQYNWQYDVVVEAKTEIAPDDETIDITVQKIWKNDKAKNRPKEIVAELYADDKLYDAVALNKENNWKYTWTGLDADAKYSVKEKEVPEGYKVVVERQENDFVITNTKTKTKEDPDPPPSTEPPTTNPPSQNPPPANPPSSFTSKLPQTGVLWWPVPILLFAGILLIFIGIFQCKSNVEE